MEARLVDDDDTDVPVGKSGELWVRGPNIMKYVYTGASRFSPSSPFSSRGYLGKPEATRNALTPDGWYKTGDVCIVDSQGVYKIVDRKKELIKVKGVSPSFVFHRDWALCSLSSSKSPRPSSKVSFSDIPKSPTSESWAFGKNLWRRNCQGMCALPSSEMCHSPHHLAERTLFPPPACNHLKRNTSSTH